MKESTESSKPELVPEPENQESHGAGISVSDKKLAANRRNSKLSTGPKTKAGKNRSRRNSTKHGILTSVLLIRDGAGAEACSEFDRLFTDLRQAFKPVGGAEKLLVELISICLWRERRALQCEAGEIQQAFLYDGWLRRRQWAGPADEIEAMKLCFILPAGGLESRLRYQTANRRQLIATWNQLERMQRARKEEEAPAPGADRISSK